MVSAPSAWHEIGSSNQLTWKECGQEKTMRGAQSHWAGHTAALMARSTRVATSRGMLRVQAAKGKGGGGGGGNVVRRYGPNEVDEEVSGPIPHPGVTHIVRPLACSAPQRRAWVRGDGLLRHPYLIVGTSLTS